MANWIFLEILAILLIAGIIARIVVGMARRRGPRQPGDAMTASDAEAIRAQAAAAAEQSLVQGLGATNPYSAGTRQHLLWLTAYESHMAALDRAPPSAVTRPAPHRPDPAQAAPR